MITLDSVQRIQKTSLDIWLRSQKNIPALGIVERAMGKRLSYLAVTTIESSVRIQAQIKLPTLGPPEGRIPNRASRRFGNFNGER